MRLLIAFIGLLILSFEVFAALFAFGASGVPQNIFLSRVLLELVVIGCSLVGVIGMFRCLRTGRFWIFACAGIGVPLAFWLYSAWPEAGIAKSLLG